MVHINSGVEVIWVQILSQSQSSLGGLGPFTIAQSNLPQL